VAGAVGKVLGDLGVSPGLPGISLSMYQDLLCEIKYEVLTASQSRILLEGTEAASMLGDALLTPRKAKGGASNGTESGLPSGASPASTPASPGSRTKEAIVKEIMKNACMIAVEEGNGTGWKEVKAEKGITMWTREIAGSVSKGVKVSSTMPLSCQQIYDVLVDPQTELSGSGHDGDRLIADYGEGITVRWSRFKVPLCEASDFVNGEYSGECEGGLTYAFCGVEHPDCPPKPKHVRGRVLLGGWRMSAITQGPEKGRTRVTCISVCDLNRPIPKILADLGTKTSFKSMKALQSLLKKKYKKK